MGLADTVVLVGGRYGRHYQHSISQEEILGPVPPVPMFPETMEDVRERLEARLPKVPLPRNLSLPILPWPSCSRETTKSGNASGACPTSRPGTPRSMTPPFKTAPSAAVGEPHRPREGNGAGRDDKAIMWIIAFIAFGYVAMRPWCLSGRPS